MFIQILVNRGALAKLNTLWYYIMLLYHVIFFPESMSKSYFKLLYTVIYKGKNKRHSHISHFRFDKCQGLLSINIGYYHWLNYKYQSFFTKKNWVTGSIE